MDTYLGDRPLLIWFLPDFYHTQRMATAATSTRSFSLQVYVCDTTVALLIFTLSSGDSMMTKRAMAESIQKDFSLGLRYILLSFLKVFSIKVGPTLLGLDIFTCF